MNDKEELKLAKKYKKALIRMGFGTIKKLKKELEKPKTAFPRFLEDSTKQGIFPLAIVNVIITNLINLSSVICG